MNSVGPVSTRPRHRCSRSTIPKAVIQRHCASIGELGWGWHPGNARRLRGTSEVAFEEQKPIAQLGGNIVVRRDISEAEAFTQCDCRGLAPARIQPHSDLVQSLDCDVQHSPGFARNRAGRTPPDPALRAAKRTLVGHPGIAGGHPRADGTSAPQGRVLGADNMRVAPRPDQVASLAVDSAWSSTCTITAVPITGISRFSSGI